MIPQHLLSFTTCNVCKVHLPLDWVLEAHYATADGHPKCERCGFGFRDEEEFSLVRATVDSLVWLDRLSASAFVYDVESL